MTESTGSGLMAKFVHLISSGGKVVFAHRVALPTALLFILTAIFGGLIGFLLGVLYTLDLPASGSADLPGSTLNAPASFTSVIPDLDLQSDLSRPLPLLASPIPDTE